MRRFATPPSRKFTAASGNSLDYAAAVISSAPLTMACWFLTNDLTTNQSLIQIVLDTEANPGNNFGLFFGGTTAGDPIRANTTAAGTFQAASTSTGAIANRWYHAAGVFTSATSRSAYIDGGSKATNSSVSLVPAGLNHTAIGERPYSTPDLQMSGEILWPAIWNVALGDIDIYALSRGAHPLTIHPESLVAFWDWTGANTEFGLRGTYPLVNSGSVPVNGPAFLSQPVLRRRRHSDAAAAAQSQAPRSLHQYRQRRVLV